MGWGGAGWDGAILESVSVFKKNLISIPNLCIKFKPRLLGVGWGRYLKKLVLLPSWSEVNWSEGGGRGGCRGWRCGKWWERERAWVKGEIK